MLLPYPDPNVRRSIYSVLLGLAVLGPVVLASLSFAGVVAHWLEGVSFLSGFLGTAFLCIWCAVYVRDEPQRVRIALIWIALLFLFVTGVLLTATVSYKTSTAST